MSRRKYARKASSLLAEAEQLHRIASRLEEEAANYMEAAIQHEAGSSIHYDMESDGQDGSLSVLDSAINPKDDGELEALQKSDSSAISEDPDEDFSGLISNNDFRPRKQDTIKSSSVRRKVRR